MEFLNCISNINSEINSFMWNKLGIALLIFSGLFLSFKFRFFQFKIVTWLKLCILSFKGTKSGGNNSISPFQSACTALAATLGVGNIVGVSAAIYVGGPGAVFWMWIAAFFGMIISYAENIMGLKYRIRNFDGEWSGGAMYYLSDGISGISGMSFLGKALSRSYAAFTLLASFGIGAMGQVNKIVINLEAAFPSSELSGIILYDSISLYALVLGILIFALSALVVLGGIGRIARFTEKLVPFMIMFFCLGSVTVIFKNYTRILPSVLSIFKGAFSFEAGIGATMGIAFEQGFKRGVFSNEAGMGTSAMVHAAASGEEPCEQAMLGIFEVFVDTIVVCTVTALVILCSGVYSPLYSIYTDDATMVAAAFGTVFGDMGTKFIAVSIFLFAFSSCVAWNFYGSKAWEYLFGLRHVNLYKCMHLASLILGAVVSSSIAWDISDTFNAMMLLPNLIGVLLLSSYAAKINKEYQKSALSLALGFKNKRAYKA